MTTLQRTPLFSAHVSLGAKMVPFAGWEMPVQYPAGVIAEHEAVRNAVGIFDVSHMGEIVVEGDGALAFLQEVTTNDVSKLVVGKAHYSLLCNEQGGVIDDIIVYQLGAKRYLLCVNASNAEKDYAWINSKPHHGVTVENVSSQFGQIAVQGPKAKNLLADIFGEVVIQSLKYFEAQELEWKGVPVILARTGYTGEDGAEIFIPADKTELLWNVFISSGAQPCGLGARDTLRLEACYPLHGHELSETISALESGVGWVVKTEKSSFIGKAALVKEKEAGSIRALIGFHAIDPGIIREGSKIFSETGDEVGIVTSGTKTPTVQKAIGLGMVKKQHSSLGGRLFAEVRGRKIAVEVVKTPFYKTGTPPPR